MIIEYLDPPFSSHYSGYYIGYLKDSQQLKFEEGVWYDTREFIPKGYIVESKCFIRNTAMMYGIFMRECTSTTHGYPHTTYYRGLKD